YQKAHKSQNRDTGYFIHIFSYNELIIISNIIITQFILIRQ
ncbi:hypothetical protein S1OALGB6SA_351, partial [Olavius algarvensis spirochete endosymbiont]